MEKNNIAFLDLSSTCVGYAIGNWELRNAEIIDVGIMKWKNKVSHGEKYIHLMRKITNEWAIYHNIGSLVIERYSINPKRMMGCLVCAELHGVCKAAAYEIVPPLDIALVTPNQWKKLVVGHGRADKSQVKKKIRELYPEKIPPKIINPATGKIIRTPSDLFDAVAIATYWFKEAGCENIEFKAEVK